MDDMNYRPSRKEFKIGHTIIGICLVASGILISVFATGQPVATAIISIILIGYGLIKIVIAQSV